jgi:CheY-like chemotaxis protein
MVIEDNQNDFHLLVQACRALSLPCVLECQTTGEFGILALNHAARAGRLPDIVIIELDLPGMSGGDVLRHIRKNAALCSVMALVLTGSSQPQDRALGALADSYLAKPALFAGWKEIAYLISEWATRRKPIEVDVPRHSSPRMPHLLHVDDDLDDRQLFARAFLQSGLPGVLHSMGGATDALLYLNRLRPYADAVRPTLIIYDLSVPRLAGRSLLELIKTNVLYNAIAVIVLSGSESVADMHRCREMGADDYVVKPSSYDGLVEIIASFESVLTESSTDLPIVAGTSCG